MASPAPVPSQGHTNWAKSRYSANADACVEVALPTSAAAEVAVRDDKLKGTGPVLTFSPGAWSAFTTSVVAPGSPLAGGF